MTSLPELPVRWCDRCDTLLPPEALHRSHQGDYWLCKDREACNQRSSQAKVRLTAADLMRIGFAASRGLSCDSRDAARLVGEVRRLRGALRDYGEHDAGCYMRYTEAELTRSQWTPALLAERQCTCGLAEEIGAP